MRDPLRFHFLEQQMKELMEKSDTELGRLTDDMELEVQPFDPEYEDRLRKWRADATQNGGTYTEAEEVLEKMLIYYDLTARIFTRNVITQVVERHLLLGMLRLFNPIEILRMADTSIEAIAAENKETRERRTALKSRKKAIEEARSICASLAMRSELRGFEDEPGEDTPSDDEEATSLKRQSSVFYAQSSTPRHDSSSQRRTTEAQGPDRSPSRASWDPVQPALFTTTQGEQPAAPRHGPPPPPRPGKVGFEESERYYDTTPRPESASQNNRGKDSARHRLASAMRLNSQS